MQVANRDERFSYTKCFHFSPPLEDNIKVDLEKQIGTAWTGFMRLATEMIGG
jgi:hypothetical protein